MRSSGGPPEGIRLLLDETLAGKSIVAGLGQAGIPALPLQDIAPRGISDVEVAEVLDGQSGLYLLTRDKDFRYHPAVKQRLIECGVGVFVITSAGNKRADQIVDLVVAAWPRIQAFATHHARPFVAKIIGRGQVYMHR